MSELRKVEMAAGVADRGEMSPWAHRRSLEGRKLHPSRRHRWRGRNRSVLLAYIPRSKLSVNSLHPRSR